jgi:uncharacterized ParB-like nuclease family protein
MKVRMRRMSLFAVVAVTFVVMLAGTTLAQSSNPTNVGTWELNVAKSNSSSGTAPKSVTLTIAAAGAGFKHSVDVLNADGTVGHYESSGNYDGKDCPIIGNNANADMVARTRVDANTVRTIYKKGGKVTTTATSVVSSNGKTMTVTTTGTNASGQAVNTVAVYDKQTNIGTWKLNIAKSKIPADKVPKSASFKVEAAGAGIKATVDSVGADGVVRHWALSGKYDGKDNPITGNCQYGDIVALARIDVNTTTSTYKMGGKVNMTQTLVVSSDGKTMTVTGTSTDANGQAVSSVAVYDKQ